MYKNYIELTIFFSLVDLTEVTLINGTVKKIEELQAHDKFVVDETTFVVVSSFNALFICH
jgi:hypothetical protein